MSKEVKNVNCKCYYKYEINRYFIILDSISSVILKSSQKLL